MLREVLKARCSRPSVWTEHKPVYLAAAARVSRVLSRDRSIAPGRNDALVKVPDNLKDTRALDVSVY